MLIQLFVWKNFYAKAHALPRQLYLFVPHVLQHQNQIVLYQWFIPGEARPPQVVVNKFPGGCEPLRALKHAIFIIRHAIFIISRKHFL